LLREGPGKVNVIISLIASREEMKFERDAK